MLQWSRHQEGVQLPAPGQHSDHPGHPDHPERGRGQRRRGGEELRQHQPHRVSAATPGASVTDREPLNHKVSTEQIFTK